MRFEFATATRIIFGAGELSGIGTLARELGRRAFVVTGRTAQRAVPLVTLLNEHGIHTASFSVRGEPEIEEIQQATELAKQSQSDLVISFGGGRSEERRV